MNDTTTMNQPQAIDAFLSQVRSRLNRFLLLDSLFGALAVMASLLTLASLVYLFRGYAVPRFLYPVAVGSVLFATLLRWSIQRWTDRSAARFADDFFNLKDSLSSSLSFRARNTEEFIWLQEKSTVHQIASLDPRTIRYQWPRRSLATAFILVLLSSSLAFVEASPAIIRRQQIETETASKTKEINEYLTELVKEIERELELERESAGELVSAELDPVELRKWVDDLEQTQDPKEALRQYAQLERKLTQAASRLDQRKNEQLLNKAGKEIQKDAENRRIGRRLEDKKYRDAATDLEGMKASPIDPGKLNEQKKELARLKLAAQRMAAAAKSSNRQAASSQNPGTQQARRSPSNLERSGLSQAPNQAGSEANNSPSGQRTENPTNNSQQGEDLDSQMLALENSLQAFEKSLERCLVEKKKLSQCSKESLAQCENCRNAVRADIDKLAKSLKQCDAKRKRQMRLLAMCKQAGRCQQYLSQTSNRGQQPSSDLGQFMNMEPGGKGAGTDAKESRRDQRDPLVDNGNVSQLKGIQGAGSVRSTTEVADEGSGVSTRRNAQRNRDFSRQIESFVQREDVPEDVKRGVKEYFENIHQSE